MTSTASISVLSISSFLCEKINLCTLTILYFFNTNFSLLSKLATATIVKIPLPNVILKLLNKQKPITLNVAVKNVNIIPIIV